MGRQEIILTPGGAAEASGGAGAAEVGGASQVAERIRQAKAFGDISENSEYDVAKAEQARIEGRIESLQYILQSAVLADPARTTGTWWSARRCACGTFATGEEVEYHLVGAMEADPVEFRISNQSPLGESLMGHVAGDTITFTTPGGPRLRRAVGHLSGTKRREGEEAKRRKPRFESNGRGSGFRPRLLSEGNAIAAGTAGPRAASRRRGA